ncbi:MAG: MFS transporter [Candidatus Woesearchaeota archaeon]
MSEQTNSTSQNQSDDMRLREKASKISIVEGSAYSVMDGFGLRYVIPYALALGFSNVFIGLLSSLPGLIGSISQIFSSKLVGKYTRKRIITIFVSFQAFMWLPLLGVGIISLVFKLPILITSILLIAVFTILVTFSAFVGPAWGSWMKDLVTRNRDSYFAKRNLITGIIGLMCTFIAGVVLDYFKTFHLLLGFGVIFSIALIGRGISAYLFTRKYEPPITKVEGSYFSFVQFIKKISLNNFGRFVIFSSLISFATAVASPFFAVYMLKNLGFSYIDYTFIVVSSIVIGLLSMPLWGKLGDKYGNITVMRLTSPFIFLIPLLWLITLILLDKIPYLVLPYLIFVEAFSGFIWSGFSLSTANFIYYAVTPQKMALCVAYNSVLISLGAFIGSTLGGTLSSYTGRILWLEPILFIFVLSSVLRLVTVLIMLPKLKEIRDVEKFEYINLKKDIIPRWMSQLTRDIGAGIKRVGFS